MSEKFRYEFKENRTAKCSLLVGGIPISTCEIGITNNKWTISAWYTNSGYGNSGYGSKCLRALVKEIVSRCGMPEEIYYIWNGANDYVYEWMDKNFGAISMCPIAVQKSCADDDWSSHIYRLNKEKFLAYCNIS